jgi:serine phosphatase RsbU (regulator of sigma subunit)
VFCNSQNRIIDSLINRYKLNNQDTLTIIKLNESLINFYNNSLTDSAEYYATKALRFHKDDNIYIARTYNVVANCLFLKGVYTVVIKNYLTALRIYEKFNYKTGIANCFNNLGNVYRKQNYFTEAISFHNKVLNIRSTMRDTANIALSYNNLGNVYQAKKNYAQAINFYEKSIMLKRQMKDTFSVMVGLDNLGGLYCEMENCEKAKSLLYEANSLIKLLNVNTEDVSINEINLCYAHYICGDIKTAKKYGLSAVNRAEKYQDIDTRLGGYKHLTDIYTAERDFKAALFYLDKYNRLKDSIFNLDNTKKLLAEQFQYNLDKQAEAIKLEQIKKDAEANVEKQKQKQTIFLISCILIIMVLFVFYAFWAYYKKEKVSKQVIAQNHLISQKQKEIIDSINYAKRIQSAILPDEESFIGQFSDGFVYYQPKDIVSGDLYWFAKVTTTTQNPLNFKVVAVADCTGHGVPGAFMSMLSVQLLNESIKNPMINSPQDLLHYMNNRILTDLHKSHNLKINDGLDIAVAAIDYNNNVLYYSGANRPLWLLREERIIEYKATKAAIGGLTDINHTYESNSIDLIKGDKIYLFTDGITDQFGGTKDKKFTKLKLKELIEQCSNLPLAQQKEEIKSKLMAWQGNTEQTDDILILGFEF